LKLIERGYNLNTIVSEPTEHGDIPVDVYHKLSNDRILFLYNQITDNLATDIVATLLLKDAENSEKKITIFINSHGGDIRNIFMICDMMKMVSSPIETVCIGSACNEAALILGSGTPGMRFATKNSLIIMGQLTNEWSTHTNLTNAKKYLNLAVSDNKRMMESFAKITKKPVNQIMKDLEREVFLSASAAVKYNLIDKVIAFNKKDL